MKRINVAIEVADENLDARELRAQAAEEYGVRIVLTPEYADKMVVVVSDDVPPVRRGLLTAALARFGVALATPSTFAAALERGAANADGDGEGLGLTARKRLRRMFDEFKSNPLSRVGLRGKDPSDRSKLERKLRAKRFKEVFYENLAEFIADHPSLPYTAYWEADGRPLGRQWPEYRAAVKVAKIIRADREERKRGGAAE